MPVVLSMRGGVSAEGDVRNLFAEIIARRNRIFGLIEKTPGNREGIRCVRIWSLHPRYLDAKGLVALWREALLAREVLCGRTRGYRRHPQLIRFRNCPQPIAAVNYYLREVYEESGKRGYHFDGAKIGRKMTRLKLSVTDGQLAFEWEHLKKKLKVRDPALYEKARAEKKIKPHPLFKVMAGTVEKWEISAGVSRHF